MTHGKFLLDFINGSKDYDFSHIPSELAFIPQQVILLKM
jgi:hypothetical protein